MALGDHVMMKKEYKTKFPNVSTFSILKVEKIDENKATVVFMNDKDIYHETVPVNALFKVG